MASNSEQGGMVAAIERMSTSKGNLYTGLTCDWATGLLLLTAALYVGQTSWARALVTVVAGFFIFSFIEYAAHRWLFHVIPGPFKDGHTRHHKYPHGYDALPFFVPPLFMCALAAGFSFLMPAGYALLLTGAIALGYALYGSSHTVLHRHTFSGPLSRPWQVFHDQHHEHPDKNFGVTTPLWDVLLGTRYRDPNDRDE